MAKIGAARWLPAIVALVTMTTATGCANDEGDEAVSSSSSIVGGYAESGRANVVAVVVDTGQSSKGTSSICSGTLIARNLVLTAAHCVIDQNGVKYAGHRVVFGSDAQSGMSVPVIWTAADWRYSPKVGFAYDAAVLFLADLVDIEPAEPAYQLGQWLVGRNVTAVGFGMTDGAKGDSAGTKMTTTMRVVSLEQTHFGVGSAGNTLCHGDSGGPIFLNLGGKEMIVGITSWGKGDCSDGAYAQRTDVVADFIRPMLDYAAQAAVMIAAAKRR